jgi:hypothetical protein
VTKMVHPSWNQTDLVFCVNGVNSFSALRLASWFLDLLLMRTTSGNLGKDGRIT